MDELSITKGHTLTQPYYHDDASGITIYHGDCRDILPTLGHVDLVLTDPPYGKGYSTGYRANVARSSTRVVNDHNLSTLEDVLLLIDPILSADAVIYCFAAPLLLDSVMPLIRRLGAIPNLLVWDKGNCTAGDLETTYGPQWEAIVYGRKSRSPLVGGRDRDVIRISRGNTHAYLHPTQKPVALCSYLIGRHIARSVLDPFMGSGSSAVAAKEMGRRYIGCEIEERYCEIAATRLQQTVMNLEAA